VLEIEITLLLILPPFRYLKLSSSSIIENLLPYGNCQLDPLWGVMLKLNLAIAKEVATGKEKIDSWIIVRVFHF